MHLFHRQRTHSIGPIEISGLVTARTISLRIWKCWRRDAPNIMLLPRQMNEKQINGRAIIDFENEINKRTRTSIFSQRLFWQTEKFRWWAPSFNLPENDTGLRLNWFDFFRKRIILFELFWRQKKNKCKTQKWNRFETNPHWNSTRIQPRRCPL